MIYTAYFHTAQLRRVSDSKICYTFPIHGTSVSVFSSVRSHAASKRPIRATDTDDRGKYSSTTRRTKKNSRTTSNGPWSRAAGRLLYLNTSKTCHSHFGFLGRLTFLN